MLFLLSLVFSFINETALLSSRYLVHIMIAGTNPLATNIIASHWINNAKHIYFAYCSTLAIYFFEFKTNGKNQVAVELINIVAEFEVNTKAFAWNPHDENIVALATGTLLVEFRYRIDSF